MTALRPLFLTAIAAALALSALLVHRRWIADNPPPLLLVLGLVGALLLAGLAVYLWARSIRAALFTSESSSAHDDETIARWGQISFSGNPMPMLLIDPSSGNVVDANEAAARFYGYSRDELRHIPLTQANLSPLDAIRAYVDRAIHSGPQEIVLRQRRADGSQMDVVVTAGPVRSQSSTLLLALVQDVTAQKRAEESFRHVVDASPAGLHTYAAEADGTLVLTAANPAADRILGATRSALIRQPLAKIFAGPDSPSLHACLYQIAKNGGHWSVENYTSQTPQGPKTFGVTAFQVAPGQVAVMFIDTTEQHRHEEMLARSERRFRQLYERSPVGIVMVDIASGTIQGANPQCAQILGQDLPALHLQSFADLPAPAGEPSIPADVFCDTAMRTMQRRFIRPDGNVIWLELTFTCMAGDSADDSLIGLVIMQDITERRTAEEQLLQAKHAAEHASAAKDQFLATLSHELRTPLTPVLLTTQSLRADTSLSPAVREDLLTVQRNVELEARLIDDLLDLTRIVRGKMQLHRTHIDLHDCIRSAVEICRDDLRKKSIRLELVLEAERHTVYADSSRLHQVIWNLVKNAIKFTANGGLVVVTTRNDRQVVPGEPPPNVVCEVADNGVGMDQQTLSRIFVPFEQGSARVTRLFGGLGMGLAISKAIVDLHGGKISAFSMGAGTGALFTMSLETTAAEKATSEAPPPRLEPILSATTVLLVEDHEATARVLTRLLTRSGYRVINASDVAGATRLARTQKIDLLISDLGLPDGSGLDVVRAIRKDQPVPAIAVSGYGMEQDIRNSLEAGFSDHLTKPVNLDSLQHAIEQALAGHVSASAPAVE